ncbi:MAG: ATP-grasp domain-containing protein [Methylococcaceae bacterium]|nr:ATP-grasp domain-containing protein [Methylococcaceae bacterium]
MKILIFEFITGGGLAQKDISEALFNEGQIMLKALLSDLVSLPHIQLTLLLDCRNRELEIPEKINVVWVSNEQNIDQFLLELIEAFDFVWPVAPEMDLELYKVSASVEGKAKRLLNSSSQAVAICSDKLLTAQILKKNGLAVIETYLLDSFLQSIESGAWVIKPKDGVGCLNSYYISCQNEFDRINTQIADKGHFIIQPYITGEPLSLSCLFKNGEAWLICCNRQQVAIKQKKFELEACEVNISTNKRQLYQQLIEKIAQSITGLWGYVGIDIIQSEFEMPLILEINPRLTTSFSGINKATGINIGKEVINLVDNKPAIQHTRNKQITIQL